MTSVTTASLLREQKGFAEGFFRQAMAAGALVHAYVLKGQDMDRMYRCTLWVAKCLNCEKPVVSADRDSERTPCGACPSCRWVDRNAHPAVITLSRLTYLVSDEGKDLTLDDLDKLSKKTPQTQIKTEQIGRLVQQLGVSSQYTRVVIFTDAEEGPTSLPSNITPPQDWQAVPANEKKSFHLRPLSRHLFNANSANRFLKTLEEPPPKTLFFFLSDSEENLLETIVSRCQVIPFAGAREEANTATTYPPEAETVYQQLITTCLSESSVDIYALSATFNTALITGLDLSPTQALLGFQRYIRQEYNKGQWSFAVYAQVEKALEHAIRRLNSKTNTEQTIHQLFWELSKS